MLENKYLDKEALALVKNVTNIDEIWDHLKDVFCDRKTLLANKLLELNNCDLELNKCDDQKIQSKSRTKRDQNNKFDERFNVIIVR